MISLDSLVSNLNRWCFDENNLTPVVKEKEREQIKRDTEEYLRNDNHIQQIPSTFTAYN